MKNSKSLTHRSAAEPVASAMNATNASANATVKSSAVNATNVVNPEALKLGKERFDVRDDFVIVLRVLPRDEIQGSGEVTQKIRGSSLLSRSTC